MSGEDGFRGLIVDWGGVLTTSLRESFAAFCQREGIDPERLRDLLKTSYRDGDPESIIVLVETGRIPVEEFNTQLAAVFSEAIGRPIEAEGLVDRMTDGLKLEHRVIDAVRGVRAAGIRTALLSNSWGLKHYPQDLLRELFDQVVISGDVGMRKPDPDIFRLAADRLGLPPEACVFVDDFFVNVEQAEKVGMRGVLHEDAERTVAKLEALFGAPADRPG